MMNKKGIKTTIVAFIILIIGIGIITAFIFDEIDGKDFAVAIGSLLTLGTSTIGWLAKDKDKSHTQN